MLYSLILIYVGSNNSEYFGVEFSFSIFLVVSMLGFDSFDAGVDKYFHSGSRKLYFNPQELGVRVREAETTVRKSLSCIAATSI